MKSCQIDTKLLIHTPKLNLGINLMIWATRLRIILNLLKIKHLLNQKQSQLELHNTIHPITQILLSPRRLRHKHKIYPSVHLLLQFCESFTLEQTPSDIDCLRLQHQQLVEAANQIEGKQELEHNQRLQQLNQFDSEKRNCRSLLDFSNLNQQQQKNYHHNKLIDLSFPFLLGSFFISLEKDEKQLWLRKLLALPKVLN